MDLPRPSAEDPPEEFLRSGAENPLLDLSRPGAEQIFLLYIEEKIFCARAQRIHLWIYHAPARNRFSSLYRGENFPRSARRIHLRIYCARARNRFSFYIEEKIFCARARRIHLRIYRARARNRFSSIYRGENFLRSGAENPPLPGRGTDFLLYIEEKIFCAWARRIHLRIYRARAWNRFFFSI